MDTLYYRQVDASDVPAMARIRAQVWGDEPYWTGRISRYLAGEEHPQHALVRRMIYVAVAGDAIVGLIAGHLTRRYGCDGELEWINVTKDRRKAGIASELLRRLAGWFIDQKAIRICVDVEPANTTARAFYMRHGALNLNPHWLVWEDINIVLGKQNPASGMGET